MDRYLAKEMGICISRYIEQGHKKDKPMADKLMYIPNDDTQSYPIYRLHLVVETFGDPT